MEKVGHNFLMSKPKKRYPTDLNDTQWQIIAQYLPKEAETGRPRTHSWRGLINAMMYVVKNGIVWRALPHDYPPWKTVYHYFRLMMQAGEWERLNRKVREAVRNQAGRKSQASAMVIDSQSARSAEGGPERGYDGGKRVTGRKRNLLVDTLGLVVVAKVTSAKLQDVHAGQVLLKDLASKKHLFSRLEVIFADGGYRGAVVDLAAELIQVRMKIVLKDPKAKGFQVMPKRWVVERTFAWLTRHRRLARDYERLPETSEAFIFLAMIRLGLRRLAPT